MLQALKTLTARIDYFHEKTDPWAEEGLRLIRERGAIIDDLVALGLTVTVARKMLAKIEVDVVWPAGEPQNEAGPDDSEGRFLVGCSPVLPAQGQAAPPDSIPVKATLVFDDKTVVGEGEYTPGPAAEDYLDAAREVLASAEALHPPRDDLEPPGFLDRRQKA